MHIFWQIIGLLITFVLIWLIVRILGKDHKFRNIFEVSENGGYSLSRLQAFLWAWFIISFQISTMIVLGITKNFEAFEVVFSEEILWLLGISMGSTITSNGITLGSNGVSLISKPNDDNKQVKNKSRLSDIVTSTGEGLDFSKIQMLIWTLIALTQYFIQCSFFLNNLLYNSPTFDIVKDYFLVKNIPTIDKSFVVLMGLSQGFYLGRKALPSLLKKKNRKKINEK